MIFAFYFFDSSFYFYVCVCVYYMYINKCYYYLQIFKSIYFLDGLQFTRGRNDVWYSDFEITQLCRLLFIVIILLVCWAEEVVLREKIN